MVKEVKLVQPENAELSMMITLSGMVALLMLLFLTPLRIVPDSSNKKCHHS